MNVDRIAFIVGTIIGAAIVVAFYVWLIMYIVRKRKR